MRLKVLLASLLMMSLIGLFPSLANAQCGQGDEGVCDTVRIVGCPFRIATVVPGDSIMVPIYIWNDEEIGGFSLGFKFDSTALEVVKKRYSFAGSVIPVDGIEGGVVKETYDPAALPGQYLFGWIEMTGEVANRISVNTTDQAKLLVTLNFKVKSTATPMTITLDSTYVGEAGPFILSIAQVGTSVHPQYVHCAEGDIVLPVQEVQAQLLPQSYELGQNMPNPFNPNTVITFAVPRPSEVKIEVFNVLGQKVKILANEFSKAGYKRVEWDGTDDNGNSVASGVYLYRMTAGDFSETKKMLLLK